MNERSLLKDYLDLIKILKKQLVIQESRINMLVQRVEDLESKEKTPGLWDLSPSDKDK